MHAQSEGGTDDSLAPPPESPIFFGTLCPSPLPLAIEGSARRGSWEYFLALGANAGKPDHRQVRDGNARFSSRSRGLSCPPCSRHPRRRIHCPSTISGRAAHPVF